jgi:catechol 2,3-dioxygenase-like lactoylglutathione lyase family enzyme
MTDWELSRLYHTVVNCRDIKESVAFYKLLGFEVLHDRRDLVWSEYLAGIFGLKRAQGRGVLMGLPTDCGGPMLDLIECVAEGGFYGPGSGPGDRAADHRLRDPRRSRGVRGVVGQKRALHLRPDRATRGRDHRRRLQLRPQHQCRRTDQTGRCDDLVAEGVVERNRDERWAHVKWNCRIGPEGIRHQSDLTHNP